MSIKSLSISEPESAVDKLTKLIGESVKFTDVVSYIEILENAKKPSSYAMYAVIKNSCPLYRYFMETYGFDISPFFLFKGKFPKEEKEFNNVSEEFNQAMS